MTEAAAEDGTGRVSVQDAMRGASRRIQVWLGSRVGGAPDGGRVLPVKRGGGQEERRRMSEARSVAALMTAVPEGSNAAAHGVCV